MKVKLNKSIEGQLTFENIRCNNVYVCTSSPGGTYDNWVLIGIDSLDIFGLWAGKGLALFNTSTINFAKFKFKEIQAELVEI